MSNLVLSNRNFVRRNPERMGNFSTWTSFIDNLLNEDVSGMNSNNFNEGISTPKVNIKETDEAFTLEMAVPGYKKSDFVIDLENDTLSVSAEIKEAQEDSKENFTRIEFGYASFKRTFVLPETVEESKIEATYKDGILGLHIPKKEEAKPKPARTIKIG